MGWRLAAQGASFSELERLMSDRELRKGDRVRVEMDCSGYDWLFNIAGAEMAFSPYVPEGMDIVDVWGEGGKAYVEMEADPAWLFPVLAKIAYWGVIVIAIGFVLFLIVSFVRLFIWGGAEGVPTALLIGAGLGILGIIILGKKTSRSPPPQPVGASLK